jgi:hypothetical protein
MKAYRDVTEKRYNIATELVEHLVKQGAERFPEDKKGYYIVGWIDSEPCSLDPLQPLIPITTIPSITPTYLNWWEIMINGFESVEIYPNQYTED